MDNWDALSPDGKLEGHIYFHLGGDSAFRAERVNPVIQSAIVRMITTRGGSA
jgi:hypothetical protein